MHFLCLYLFLRKGWRVGVVKVTYSPKTPSPSVYKPEMERLYCPRLVNGGILKNIMIMLFDIMVMFLFSRMSHTLISLSSRYKLNLQICKNKYISLLNQVKKFATGKITRITTSIETKKYVTIL